MVKQYIQLSDDVTNLDFTGNVITSGNIQLGTSPLSSTGNLRVAHGFSLNGRNNANSADANVLRWGSATNRVEIGEDTNVADVTLSSATSLFGIIGGNQVYLWGASLFEIQTPTVQFEPSVATPTINQADDGTNDITGDALTIHAQDVTGGGTSITGGSLTIRGGNSTGGSATTETGGDLNLSSGNGNGPTTSGKLNLQYGGTTVMQLASATLATAVATTGDLRVGQDFTMAGRNAADTGNAFLVRWGAATNRLEFGEDNSNFAGSTFSAPAAGNHQFNVGGVTVGSVQQTKIQIGRNGTSGSYELQFFDDVTAASITHEGIGDAVAADFTITAQGNNSASNAAGDLILNAGNNSGAGSDGIIQLRAGNQTMFEIVNVSAAANLRIPEATNDPNIVYEARTSAGAGGTFSILGQHANGTNVGGNVNLEAGDAAGTNQNGGTLTLASGDNTGSGSSRVNIIAGLAGTVIDARASGTTKEFAVFGATPVAQPSGTGETTGFTAGSGTGVNDDSTFTGNVGSTAYRISDIVKHLKNLGLIAS